MMMAGIGGRRVVRGRSMAIPAVGPMPGRTPTKVPRMEPTRAKNKFSKERALENPWSSKPNISTSFPLLDPQKSSW
jgi:hypothetical protein